MSVRFSNQILIPGWITIFGLLSLGARPMGPALSLLVFTTGVVVIPVLVSIPSHVLARAGGVTIGSHRWKVARFLTVHV